MRSRRRESSAPGAARCTWRLPRTILPPARPGRAPSAGRDAPTCRRFRPPALPDEPPPVFADNGPIPLREVPSWRPKLNNPFPFFRSNPLPASAEPGNAAQARERAVARGVDLRSLKRRSAFVRCIPGRLDPDALKLADAQLVIARGYGSRAGAAMKHKIDVAHQNAGRAVSCPRSMNEDVDRVRALLEQYAEVRAAVNEPIKLLRQPAGCAGGQESADEWTCCSPMAPTSISRAPGGPAGRAPWNRTARPRKRRR